MVREEIKKYIDDVGIKQKVLAANANMTPHALNTFLNGKRGIDVEEYVRLCDAMGVPYDKFIVRKTA